MTEKRCPCDDFTCPYYNCKTWKCELENAAEECDEMAAAYFEEIE